MNVIDKFSLKGKVAFVTGGAKGIGRTVTISFAQAGAHIAIMDLLEKNKDDVMEEIKKCKVDCKFYKGDVTKPEDCERVIQSVIKDFGRIDIGMNNAGIVNNIPAKDLTYKQWLDVIDVNLNGVFLTCQAEGKQMIKQGTGGSIINTASMSGLIVNYPQPQCSYNASKAGVIMLTKSLAYEWAKYKIRVNAIASGYIRTDLTMRGLTTEWGQNMA
jgi:NAD(P)-dependent dehydrogenase (short-subunit alcohol dehydrogenase family)